MLNTHTSTHTREHTHTQAHTRTHSHSMERQAQRALVSSWQPILALFHVLIFTVLVAVTVVLVLGVRIVVVVGAVVAAQAKLNNALNCAAQLAQEACAFCHLPRFCLGH